MNVYDFDNTILRGDSSARFFAFCLRRYPRMWTDIPAQAVNGLLFVLKLRPKLAFKQRMFGFLRKIGDVDDAVDAMTSIIEPLMIVCLAVIVGTLVIAMFQPLMSIIGTMSGG